eukprot:4412299-Prymnesium_polylepis.1
MYTGTHNWQPLESPAGGLPSTGRQSSGDTCQGTTGHAPCDNYAANGWDVPIVQTDSGEVLVTCLNPYNMTQQRAQRQVGTAFGIACILTFSITSLLGVGAFFSVRASFKRMEALAANPSSSNSSSNKPGDTIEMLQER